MVEHTDEAMAQEAERLFRLRRERSELEKRVSASEAALRKGMSERHTRNAVFGEFVVGLRSYAPARVADVDKMHRDGIFMKYSKEGTGHDRLFVAREKDMNDRPIRNDGVPF